MKELENKGMFRVKDWEMGSVEGFIFAFVGIQEEVVNLYVIVISLNILKVFRKGL